MESVVSGAGVRTREEMLKRRQELMTARDDVPVFGHHVPT